MLCAIFCKSTTYVKGCRKIAKKCFEYLVGMQKSSTFAPAIERDAVQIEILRTEMRIRTSASKKNFFLKKLLKSFGSSKKSPYLCIRFQNESIEEEFFERFRYEQASSTRLLILNR